MQIRNVGHLARFNKTPSYLSISVIVDQNNKICHVLGMRGLIRRELWVIHNNSHLF